MLLNKINSIHSSCCHENGKRHFINTNNRPKMTGPRGWALFIDLRMLVITINSSIENIPPIHLRELTQILPTINNFSYNISKTISLDYYKGESMVRKCRNLTRKCRNYRLQTDLRTAHDGNFVSSIFLVYYEGRHT